MAEEGCDREPIGKAADHCRFGESLHERQPWILMFVDARDREDHGHQDEQSRGRQLHPGCARLNRIEPR
jgi:hypothetical protein